MVWFWVSLVCSLAAFLLFLWHMVSIGLRIKIHFGDQFAALYTVLVSSAMMLVFWKSDSLITQPIAIWVLLFSYFMYLVLSIPDRFNDGN